MHADSDILMCIMDACTFTVDCGELFGPDNGQVVFIGTSAGDVATYSCIENYILRGSPLRICQADNQWSGDEPTCFRGIL